MEKIFIDLNSIEYVSSGYFISPGYGIHPTRRARKWEIIYVASGVLHIGEDEDVFALAEGNCLVLRPGHIQKGLKNYDNTLRFYYTHFFADEHKEKLSDSVIEINRFCTPVRSERIREIMHNLTVDCKNEVTDPLISALMTRLVIAELKSDLKKPDVTKSNIALQTHIYIHTNFCKNITVAYIANALGFNADYLERVFKKVYGVSISSEIKKARIEYACKLLIKSNYKNHEIAELCGFSSMQSFCRVFKQVKGISSTEYKRNMLEQKYHIE